MSHASLLGLAAALLLAGAAASLAWARRRRASGWIAAAATGAAAVPLWAVAAGVLTRGPEPVTVLGRVPGLGAAFALQADGLGAVFLAIVATIAFLATLFSIEYMTRYRGDTVAKYYPLLLVLFAAIVGVVVATDFVFFLVCWELMTFASFFLVAFERESEAAQRAALRYFVINQAAALGMLAAGVILWSRCGSFGFAELRGALGGLLGSAPLLAHLVLFLFFMGFATKAGILPMGDWLPDAYPAAPSGATAAFGGTMTKLGIYGLLRVFLVLLPLSPATRAWGLVIALAGAGSLFVGTLTALRQDDLKRLMSFHVIGQVGYMFLGIGMGLFFLPVNPALGALGLLGGFFHMVNHSLYKSCLFLGAGAVLYRTGRRDLGAGGGLHAAMPVTAMCAVGASLAIAGVPPFNGFASKWLMYATAILGGRAFPLFVLLGIVAMFISLVTLASFLKYLGGVFFGPPVGAAGMREVPRTMLLPQVVLALACVALGLVPGWALQFLHRALAGALPGSAWPDFAILLGGSASALSFGSPALGSWAPLPVAAAVAGLGLFVWLALQRAGGAERREVAVWDCGAETAGALTRYPATSFYVAFKQAFHGLYRPPAMHAPPFPRWLRHAFDVDAWLYLPIGRAVERGASGVSRTHVGLLQVYLLWIVIGAVAVTGLMLAFLR